MTHYLWIPAVIALYAVISGISRINNQRPSKRNQLILLMLGCLPLWAVVAPFSANLAFDGLLYDVIMLATMAATLAIMGAGKQFIWLNWLGLAIVIIGFTLMKL